MTQYTDLIEVLQALIDEHHKNLDALSRAHPNAKAQVSSSDYTQAEGFINGLEVARCLAQEILIGGDDDESP